jgi:hypothetical protein
VIDCVKHDEGLRTTLCIIAFSDRLDDNFPNLWVEGICLELTLRVDDMLSPTAVRCVVRMTRGSGTMGCLCHATACDLSQDVSSVAGGLQEDPVQGCRGLCTGSKSVTVIESMTSTNNIPSATTR